MNTHFVRRLVYTQCVQDLKAVLIPELSGERTIADHGSQQNCFSIDCIDRDFKNKDWDANQKGPATGPTPVSVLEMVEDGTFEQIFGSLAQDPYDLALTQDQILWFCENERDKLRLSGYSTFFLFESAGELFVACVFTTSHSVVTSESHLEVNLREFSHDYVWDAAFRRRLVIPVLEKVS